MSRKFIFFDIDGTLIAGGYGSGFVPESTRLAIQKLKENGHFVAVATGRSYAMAHKIMEDLGFDHMVSDGGNGITIDRKLLEIIPLDYEKCLALIQECEEKGFPWAFSPDNTARRLAPNSSFFDFTQDSYMKTVTLDGLKPRDYAQIYKIYIACIKPDEQKLDSLRALPWCRFHERYLFVEPNDKSIGIRKIVNHFGGSCRDVFVFGDERNDLSMFSDEWTSIAMGNAVPELKAKASYVTGDCSKDGIYQACEHFGLI